MKNLILIVAFLTLPLLGFAEAHTPASASTTELVSIKKIEDVTPRKVKAARNSKVLEVNYKKSNDIISIKAYRKSLKDKVRRERLC
ncbi:hypothetical protein DFQ05_1388 [Winogradskyella wandonensis]|uniref:Uncharacterized protein n=1 Tax=Winogradskyella wandonensis TaxID=1442586 RepID=A0A4R1KTQ7_9FLAO|nr:hypothetical protein [Winogradskyella wandonensis]TCK67609.1 hypothetical protein DFQ05_1388 [Winogradskyella wandonensis]